MRVQRVEVGRNSGAVDGVRTEAITSLRSVLKGGSRRLGRLHSSSATLELSCPGQRQTRQPHYAHGILKLRGQNAFGRQEEA